MALGITKQYSPSSGQVADSTAYNTDLTALFNALSGLETGTESMANFSVDAGGKIYLDGNSSVYIHMPSAGNVGLQAADLGFNATQKIYLDGDACTGDTYITESGGDVLDIYVGGTNMLKLTEDTVNSALISSYLTIGEAAPASTVAPVKDSLYQDNICKAWMNMDAAGTINDSFGVASCVNNSAGDYTVTWSNAFTDTKYVVVATALDNRYATISSLATTTATIITRTDIGTKINSNLFIAVFGRQA